MDGKPQPASGAHHDRPDKDDERDPEDREVNQQSEREIRDKMMDKTLADSYPASDPPSTIPDPAEEDSLDAEEDKDNAA